MVLQGHIRGKLENSRRATYNSVVAAKYLSLLVHALPHIFSRAAPTELIVDAIVAPKTIRPRQECTGMCR